MFMLQENLRSKFHEASSLYLNNMKELGEM